MIKLMLVVLFASPVVWALESSEYVEMARARSYIGGVDEGDLKVQAEIYVAPNKKKKAVIKVEPGEGF